MSYTTFSLFCVQRKTAAALDRQKKNSPTFYETHKEYKLYKKGKPLSPCKDFTRSSFQPFSTEILITAQDAYIQVDIVFFYII